MKKTLPYFFLFLAAFVTLSFVNNDIVDKLLKGLWRKINYSPQEKVYLTTDRPHYLVNDTLWFAAWLTDATFHEKNPISQLLYVQLADADDNILKKVQIPVYGKNGSGYIPLNIDLAKSPSEKFSIQAYTSYMLNEDKGYIFSREINIWAAKEQITTQSKDTFNNEQESIRFFPEGGNLISGLDNNIAFEVTPHHLPNHSIVIKDDQGNTVVTTRASYNGMGMFTIKPEKNKKLYALLNGKKIDLPVIQETGYNLLVNNRSGESIKIIAQTNLPSGLNGGFIICHQRGEEIAISEPMSGREMAFRIDKKELKDGVALLTLFDKTGKPLAERSVFIYKGDIQPEMEISQNFEYYNTRSLVELDCNIIENDTTPPQGSYSISVTDLRQVNHHDENLDIRSYFLLSSELPRSIRNPGYYLKDFDSKKNSLLDIAMMVHGWSRIKSADLLTEQEVAPQYAPERGVTITGRVVGKDGKGLPRAKVDLSLLDSKNPYADVAECGRNGTFVFYDVPLLKDQVAYLKAYEEVNDKKKKTKNLNEKVIIQLDDPKALQITSDNESNIVWDKDFNPNQFRVSALEKQQNDSSYAMIKITLEEIEINSFKSQNQARIAQNEKLRKERGMAYHMYDSRIFLDSLGYVNVNWTVMDVVANHSPGARLLKRPPEPPLLTFRNKRRPPAYFLDGFPVDYNAILNVDINTVEFIDVLRSSMSSVAFGDAAYGGAVLTYTRRPGEGKNDNDDDTRKKNVAKYIGTAFQETREFYSPDHGKKSFAGPDNRITLFWSPLVKTDATGRSKIKFYTGDKKSEYLVKIEGMTLAGKPFVKYHTFEVR